MELKEIKYDLKEDGFCFLPKIFLKKEIKSAQDGLWRVINGEYRSGRKPENRFWNPGDDPSSIIKVDKPHLSDQSIWDLITNKKLGQLLGEVTKSKLIQVWHSQVIWKPHSTNQKGNAGWHRDSQYWPFWSTEGLYTAWIAISTVSAQSGPVRFLRRSNHWRKIQGMDFFNQDIKTQETKLKKTKEQKEIVNAVLNAGEVSVHSSQTYHSSLGNKEKNPRIGMVVHFRTDQSKQIELKSKESDYLDQINDLSVAPIIYQDKN